MQQVKPASTTNKTSKHRLNDLYYGQSREANNSKVIQLEVKNHRFSNNTKNSTAPVSSSRTASKPHEDRMLQVYPTTNMHGNTSSELRYTQSQQKGVFSFSGTPTAMSSNMPHGNSQVIHGSTKSGYGNLKNSSQKGFN